MLEESPEQKLKNLEETIVGLKHEIERLQAINEIQNLMAEYEVVHNPKTMARSAEFFALKQPDVSIELAMWGVFIGAEKIKNMFQRMGEGALEPGIMFVHHLTTPTIQIAKDGKTAKGLWFSPGHETFPEPDGKLQAHWCCGKTGVDFIKEDGQWKIWHYHFYDTFMTPFDKSWVDTPQPNLDVVEAHYGLKPDKPPTRRGTYFTTDIREPVPESPEPYDTWDGKSMA